MGTVNGVKWQWFSRTSWFRNLHIWVESNYIDRLCYVKLGYVQGWDISSRVSGRTKRTNPIWFCIWFGDTKSLYRSQPWLCFVLTNLSLREYDATRLELAWRTVGRVLPIAVRPWRRLSGFDGPRETDSDSCKEKGRLTFSLADPEQT